MIAGSWSLFSQAQGLQRLLKRFSERHGRRGRSAARASSSNAGDLHRSGTSILNPLTKSALISGSLSLSGDLVAQILQNITDASDSAYDISRAARMGSFGLFFYGPYQHYWYAALDRAFNARTVKNFAIKVFLNQSCLAPIVISAVFAWTLALQNKIEEFPEKCRQDFKKTLYTGWKFWVPASGVNFVFVPLRYQVLYMSCCGVVWTAFLSYSSSRHGHQISPGDEK